jgi:phytoene synthase
MGLDPHFAARGAPPGSMRWHALLYAPATARDRIAAAFALDAELREISSGLLDHGVAHAKLAWWREEATRLGRGEPRHPLALMLLSGAASPASLAGELNLALGAAEVELAQVVPQDEAEFARYLRGAGAAMARLALAPEGGDDGAARFAGHCGEAVRLVEIVRDLRHDAWRGRVFVPWAWVEDAGLRLESLRQTGDAGGLRPLLERLATLGRQAYTRSRSTTADCATDAWRPLRVLAELHMALLARMERDRFAGGRDPVELPPLSRLFIAWRAARRA